jgi:hypothetical protein
MYPSTITYVSAARIQEWREQAATDRLVIQARRARREAAAAQPRLRRRPWSKWWTGRTAVQLVPADATPDQWASALSMAGAAERADADDRQPVGGRVS